MVFSYPHTIDNGHGERLTFLRRVSTPEGEILEVESKVHPGSGPPMHVHYHQEEALTVVSGKIAYQKKGEQPQYAEAGETVVFKPGEVHKFWNAGEDELHLTGAGFEDVRVRALPADPDAKGPALFAAVASRT